MYIPVMYRPNTLLIHLLHNECNVGLHHIAQPIIIVTGLFVYHKNKKSTQFRAHSLDQQHIDQ